jgi:hypothetical protein
MTSLFGTDTSYSAMNNDFLALNLDDSDYIWGTGRGITSGEPIKYSNFIHGLKKTDGDEDNFNYLQDYQTIRKTGLTYLKDNTKPKDPSIRTVYEVVRMFPQCSEFVKLLDQSNWDTYAKTYDANSKVTYIVPTNRAILDAQSSWFHMSDPKMIKELLKAHTLNFALPFDSILGKTLEVYPLRESFSFYVDGTGKFSPNITFYQKSVGLKNYEYPTPTQRYPLIKTFETDNGMVYVMDGIFSPSILI